MEGPRTLGPSTGKQVRPVGERADLVMVNQ